MAKISKKRALDKTVDQLALERIRWLYDRFDKVVVSFSGGKDSTACLNLALQVARERKRLPLDVYTIDEEAIPTHTVEYLERARLNPDLRFKWFCIPIKCTNACTREESYWHVWEPSEKALWVRDMPQGAITELPGLKRDVGVDGVAHLIYGPAHGSVACIMGIRCQESLSRYRAIASKSGFTCFLSDYEQAPWIKKAYPIYDWSLEDVWSAPHKFGWDYNRAYDLMEQAGMTRGAQRCGSAFGAQPLRGLWSFKECWPELWAKMVDRVPGAATAGRYANTELYGVKVNDFTLPAGKTWEEQTLEVLEKLPAEDKADCARAIRSCITTHRNAYKRAGYAGVPLPDSKPDPVSGFSWKILYGIPATGSNKHDRSFQKAAGVAQANRNEAGLYISVQEDKERKERNGS